jgi:ring-1,2-phenylacetyl-CoA epoxidase subunit PaaC
MRASIQLREDPAVRYVLRIGDTCLILAQRTAEWCGHAPVLEEDLALANIALDLLGQARALLTHAGQLEGRDHGEDQLAFLREEREYCNVTLVELPGDDFGFTLVRLALMAVWFRGLWERLQRSSDRELAGIAVRALREARYHQQHVGDWVVRLGDGIEESAARMRSALARAWLYTPELFDDDEIDLRAAGTGLGPRWSELREPWLAEVRSLLGEATLSVPPETQFRSDGKRGRHSEHMGRLLAEMQHLQRAYPGGAW